MAPSLDSNGPTNGHVDDQAIHGIKNGVNGLSVQRFDYENSEFSEKNDLECSSLGGYREDVDRQVDRIRFANCVQIH